MPAIRRRKTAATEKSNRRKIMKKRLLALALCLSMIISACGSTQDGGDTPTPTVAATEAPTQAASGSGEGGGNGGKIVSVFNDIMVRRPTLLGGELKEYRDVKLTPSIQMDDVAADFSNVKYSNRFAYLFNGKSAHYAGLAEKLSENQFCVFSSSSYSEFFDLYEDNRYMEFPNFITVDSLMHTYHLYFAYLMRQTEKDSLAPALAELSRTMTDVSMQQYNALRGTAWESAAKRNVAFFYIGALLQDSSVAAPLNDGDFTELVNTELQRIQSASGIDTCGITEDYEDYTQYKPRGYYEGNPQLEAYFRAMMWYGRINFPCDDVDMMRSAALISKCIDVGGSSKWSRIYDVTSFFAGASDDPGYYETKAVFEDVYGAVPDTQTLAGNDEKFLNFCGKVLGLPKPQVNSVPVDDGEDPVVPGFRFMGQRFTVDAAIMQQLVYSAVKEDPSGEKRMLPDTLDVTAALGSQVSRDILKEQGAYDFENYTENMAKVSDAYNNDDPSIWNASLYSAWLNTLRPLLSGRGDGYPLYKRSAEWEKKSLETFAGSFAELKHDTILYSKAVIAEMGGGDDGEIVDDRGYVDPEPQVYSRFAALADQTATGLKGYGMLSDKAEEDLDRLKTIALKLLTISEKELRSEGLTEEEYEFIRCFGGDLEHFWIEANQDNVDEPLYRSQQAPCQIIADIATDPNGSVLEVGTGNVQTMYVVFPIDGELHVGSGGVYSFYQFEQPMSDRLTDTEWRKMLQRWYLDDDMNPVQNDTLPVQPFWTQSYRTEEQ